MEFHLKENEDHIPLNLLLKVTQLVGTGGEANIRIENGEVQVNGEVEFRKRNKLRSGDEIVFQKQVIKIV